MRFVKQSKINLTYTFCKEMNLSESAVMSGSTPFTGNKPLRSFINSFKAEHNIQNLLCFSKQKDE